MYSESFPSEGGAFMEGVLIQSLRWPITSTLLPLQRRSYFHISGTNGSIGLLRKKLKLAHFLLLGQRTLKCYVEWSYSWRVSLGMSVCMWVRKDSQMTSTYLNEISGECCNQTRTEVVVGPSSFGRIWKASEPSSEPAWHILSNHKETIARQHQHGAKSGITRMPRAMSVK